MSLLPGATRFLPTGYSYFNTNLRSIIVNNGLFMERFKQMTYQQEKEASLVPKPIAAASSSAACDVRKNTAAKSGSKLAFSFKQKSKLVQPAVKLDEDEDEEKNAWNTSAGGSVKSQKCGLSDSSARSAGPEVAPPSPSDNTVKKVADRLASFVAKNGRHMEHITRQRNPGDTPFKFLFDESCVDYKYYVYRLVEEEKALELAKDSQASRNGSTSSSGSSFAPSQDQTKYQTPASALCEADETIPAEAACGRSV